LPGKLVPREVFTAFAEKLANGMKVGLAKEYPDMVNKIYHRAFNWCVGQGYHHEAIHYALCARLYDEALELIAGIFIAINRPGGNNHD
tara:strand:- start:9768 stop:10031 length:264 start_codon:yes stop_codon:yes gene_type:complete